jgi:hypothetical protein
MAGEEFTEPGDVAAVDGDHDRVGEFGGLGHRCRLAIWAASRRCRILPVLVTTVAVMSA